MDILHSFNELVDVVSGFEFVKALASPDQVAKGLIMANVEHDVDVLFVFEVPIEAYNVLVDERAVDLDLTGELLTGFASSEVCL